MKLPKRSDVWLLVCAVCVLSGYFVGIEIDWTLFTLETSISLVDLMTLLLTVWVAVYVGRTLENINETDKNEKQLITSHLEELKTLINNTCIALLRDGEIPLEEVNSTLKKIGNSITRTKTYLSLVEMDFSEQIDEVTNEHIKIRRLATFTPRTTPVNTDPNNIPVRVSSNKLTYSPSHKSSISNEFEKLIDKVFSLQLCVIRHN